MEKYHVYVCLCVCVCVSLFQLSWGRINDRQRQSAEGRSEGEMMAGWAEKGEETQRGKLSLICLSRGISGLPLAINLVTSLRSDRGMSTVGGAYVCVFNCQCAYECTTDRLNSLRVTKVLNRTAWLPETDFFFSYFIASIQGHRQGFGRR